MEVANGTSTIAIELSMETSQNNKRSRSEATNWSEDSSPSNVNNQKQTRLDTGSSAYVGEHSALPTNESVQHVGSRSPG